MRETLPVFFVVEAIMVPPVHAYTNPILQFALASPLWQQSCKSVIRLLRKSLDAEAPEQARRDIARQALVEVYELQLPSSVRQHLLLDWLRGVTDSITDPLLLEALASAELDAASVGIAPYGWRFGEFAPAEDLLPCLRSSVSIKPGAPCEVPAAATAAWLEVSSLALAAELSGKLRCWSEEECIAAIRSMVLVALICKPALGVSHERQLAEFESTRLGLWRALTTRLMEVGATGGSWSDSLQRHVLLHMRGKAASEQLLGMPHESVSSEPTTTEGQPHALAVLLEAIPPATERSDKESLKTWEALRVPLPVRAAPGRKSLQELGASLHQEFPWAEGAVSRLMALLVPLSLGGCGLRMRPVLLVGPPGAGKSRFARRVAQVLKTPFMPIACGGSTDAKILSGTARGWATGEASPLLGHMLRTKCASPLVLLDELDKARSNSTAPPLESFLLGLLEPETSANWRDGYLQARCDMSHIIFWATANSPSKLSKALLSRFEIMYVGQPGPEHIQSLAASIRLEMEREWGLPNGVLPALDAHELPTKTLSVRELRAFLQRHYAGWMQDVLAPERMH